MPPGPKHKQTTLHRPKESPFRGQTHPAARLRETEDLIGLLSLFRLRVFYCGSRFYTIFVLRCSPDLVPGIGRQNAFHQRKLAQRKAWAFLPIDVDLQDLLFILDPELKAPKAPPP